MVAAWPDPSFLSLQVVWLARLVFCQLQNFLHVYIHVPSSMCLDHYQLSFVRWLHVHVLTCNWWFCWLCVYQGAQEYSLIYTCVVKIADPSHLVWRILVPATSLDHLLVLIWSVMWVQVRAGIHEPCESYAFNEIHYQLLHMYMSVYLSCTCVLTCTCVYAQFGGSLTYSEYNIYVFKSGHCWILYYCVTLALTSASLPAATFLLVFQLLKTFLPLPR